MDGRLATAHLSTYATHFNGRASSENAPEHIGNAFWIDERRAREHLSTLGTHLDRQASSESGRTLWIWLSEHPNPQALRRRYAKPRRPSIQMRFPSAEMRSRSMHVNPNAFPTLRMPRKSIWYKQKCAKCIFW